MSKRAPVDIGDGHDAYLKRQKLSHGLKTANIPQEIQSGRQLQQLLGFDQDLVKGKHGTYPTMYLIYLATFTSFEGRICRHYVIS